jgi:translation initiation factor IF-1
MDAPQATPDRTAEGVVLELLPSQLVRVELDANQGKRHQVTAHLASPVGRNYVRVIVGDRVRVALMPNDPGRGRIVEKL